MQFTLHQFEYFWDQIKQRYEQLLKEKYGYSVDWKRHAVLDARDKILKKDTFEYSTVTRLYPKPELDKHRNLVHRPFSMQGIMHQEERVKGMLGDQYLNPYLDFYEQLRKTDSGALIHLKKEKAKVYAAFCGFDDTESLLEQYRQSNHTDRYRAYFFSHIRYDVWNKGSVEINYSTQTVSVQGFYQQGAEGIMNGKYEQSGANLFIHLRNTEGNNRFMMIAKVPPLAKDFGRIIKGSLLTVSSYADQYLAATEVMLVRESELTEKLELTIKRYFFLRRTRFTVTPASGGMDFLIDPSKEEANVLSVMTGNYVGAFHFEPDKLALFRLSLGTDYRTVLELNLDTPAYQLAYIDLGKLSLSHFIWIRGFDAVRGTGSTIADQPRLGQERTLIQMEYKGDPAILSGEMSYTTEKGLLSGKMFLFRTNQQEAFPMEVCQLGKEYPWEKHLASMQLLALKSWTAP